MNLDGKVALVTGSEAASTRSPFNRLGKPQDIADVIAFVASEKCRCITKYTFQAGGGYV